MSLGRSDIGRGAPGASAVRSWPPRHARGLLVFCAIAYMLFLAAAISDKCSRVPALVNAVAFGEEMGIERQRAVDYIASSAAGFYVLGMRLTTAVVVKLVYVCVVVVAGLVTKMAM